MIQVDADRYQQRRTARYDARTVSDNYFLELEKQPDAASIRTALGEKYDWYEGILEAASGFEQEWKHYGKKYGWKLKVHDGAKTLFELTVAASSFRIGMAIRELELQSLRADPGLAGSLGDLLAADKAKEGWGIRIVMDDADRYAKACILARAVAEIRRKALAEADAGEPETGD